MPRSNAAGPSVLLMAGLVCTAFLCPADASAQRPFRLHNQFNHGETARRYFYDGYAVSTEVSYRSVGAVENGQQALRPGLGLGFRLDYQLAPHFDVSGIFDASSSNSGRAVNLSWLVLKYYETDENTDYALRLALDPSMDGQVGFPQADLSFISTSLLSPSVSSDYALGVRHVRLGYEQLVPTLPNAEPTIPAPNRDNDILYTRAVGWEAHLMMQYSLLLNPARTNVFSSVLLDYGQYNLIETSLRRAGATSSQNVPPPKPTPRPPDTPLQWSDTYRGGVVWVRSGLEYNRPGYQVLPFVSVPVRQWLPEAEAEVRARVHFGVRLMLR